MNYQYTTIDLNDWKRGELFKFYIESMRIVMSLTVDMDVTALLKYTKRNNLKFYPSMIWMVSKVLNDHDEFKYGWDSEGNLIKGTSISPSYVNFHKEDENFLPLSLLGGNMKKKTVNITCLLPGTFIMRLLMVFIYHDFLMKYKDR